MVFAEAKDLSVVLFINRSSEDIGVVGVLVSASLHIVRAHMVQDILTSVKVLLVLSVTTSEYLTAEGVGVTHSLLGQVSFASRLDGTNILVLVLEQV